MGEDDGEGDGKVEKRRDGTRRRMRAVNRVEGADGGARGESRKRKDRIGDRGGRAGAVEEALIWTSNNCMRKDGLTTLSDGGTGCRIHDYGGARCISVFSARNQTKRPKKDSGATSPPWLRQNQAVRMEYSTESVAYYTVCEWRCSTGVQYGVYNGTRHQYSSPI